MGRRAESPEFTDFLLWIGPESVFLVQTKRKVGSGDEIANHTESPQSDFKHSNIVYSRVKNKDLNHDSFTNG